LLACDARASHCRAPTWGRRRVQRGLPIKLADQGEGTALLTANARRLTGAIAGVAHKDAVSSRKPAPQACQQQPSHVRWRLMPHPVQTMPLRGAGQGHQDGEGPGPRGEWELHKEGHDHPCMTPAIGRIAVRRPHAIALLSRATHLGARMLGDRIVARQSYRPRRTPMVQQARAQGARQGPRRPAALGQHAMLGRDRPRCLGAHGA
jgi:hypothetical protein